METKEQTAERCYRTLRKFNLIDENGGINMNTYANLPTRTTPADAGLLGQVFGSDDRKKVPAPLSPPTGPILCLVMVFDGTPYRGTCFLTANNFAFTAGHNLYDHDLKKMADEVMAFAAFSRNPDKTAAVVNMNVTSTFKSSYAVSEDWGTILLDRPLGSDIVIGVMPVRAASDSDTDSTATVTGFPSVVGGVSGQTEMFTASGKLKAVVTTDKKLLYTLPTSGGNSGSPVYVESGGVQTAVGIHIGGTATTNHARLIDTELLSTIPHH